MKLRFLSKLIVVLFFLSVFASCDWLNNEEEPVPEDEYLVSYEMVKSYLPVFIETVFDQFTDDYPDLVTIKDEVEHGIFVYKVVYNTTFNGEPVEASGLVCVPIAQGSFPLISYQNGTNTLHANAPSVNPDYELYLLLEFVASTGYIITIPDYLGFGVSSNMFHPYLHKESTVQSVTDMLRATDEMLTNYLDVQWNSDLYLAGYSQGGWATMQVQKGIEQQFTGEFNLKASACGASPFDLNYINEHIVSATNYPMPYFVGYMYNSYQNLGSLTTSPGDVFQEPYASKIPTLFDGTKTGGEINDELTTVVADLFTPDYISGYNTDSKFSSIISMLTENSVTAWKTSTPTMILHGTNDDFVPPQVSTNIYQDFLSQGNSIDEVILVPLPGLGHSSGIVPSGLASVKWFMELNKAEM
jgi:pimeloyl-ACP methyl ester carboxylesterase